MEVEAYLGEEDRASHARFGPTARNRAMFGEPGHAYVYLVYGMHRCLNVVTESAGRPAAVLLRALEPLEGLALMAAARAEAARQPAGGWQKSAIRADRYAAGPANLCAALGVGLEDSGIDLCDPRAALRLELSEDDASERLVIATHRIGVAYAGEPWASMPWRFALAGHPSLSGPRRLRVAPTDR